MVHVVGLVGGALELDASAHTDVGVGVVVVHAGPATHVLHGLEVVVQELVVVGVVVVVLVGLDDGYDKGHVTGGCFFVIVAVAGFVSAAAF